MYSVELFSFRRLVLVAIVVGGTSNIVKNLYEPSMMENAVILRKHTLV